MTAKADVDVSLHTDRLQIRLIEFHVAHDCNLTCAGCSHFSPSAQRRDVAREELERDLRLAARRLTPRYVHILGGEPLLNRRLPELIPLFKTHFAAAEIKLVTNAVLLPRAPVALFHALRESSVTIAVSVYPSVGIDVAAIDRICVAWGVAVEYWRQDTFLDFFDPAGQSDPRAARANCPMEDACNVRDGHLFPCPVTAWADFGGLPFTPADGVPLTAPTEDLRAVLNQGRVTSMCRHCRPGAKRRPHTLVPRRRRGAANVHWIEPGSP